ncbi:DUF4437 domain-containing protein [Alienimonas chondri]|uniref:DUF4437 domain-containing protein n=1 Tax=Alienimonas chondri TaxID=2681879 RepID=A0ABX1V7Z2_9PLAN|nr:DUF4437 domain-containing protein [Alienimonas chondri]NNJ24313.1 hypothetical protein [Alienimonas chondri]
MNVRLGLLLPPAALLAAAVGSSAFVAAGVAQEPVAPPTSEVVLSSEVKWGALNPARGPQGPRAGDLWGDRTGKGASGFLVQFADGFASPPHIHNITYRGVVIRGFLHNDDPGAKPMWMPAGSFWTQPVGEVHVTAANGGLALAYVEIDRGPYLVQPSEDAFDDGERPVNVDASNVVWLDASAVTAMAGPVTADSPDGAKVAYLWGAPQSERPSGSFVKLPAGFRGAIRSAGPSCRAVVVEGRVERDTAGDDDAQRLEPGAYFGSTGAATHHLSCDDETGCTLYLRSVGRFEIVPAQPAATPPG